MSTGALVADAQPDVVDSRTLALVTARIVALLGVPVEAVALLGSDVQYRPPPAACSANPTCAALNLTGACCPTADNVTLDCCAGVTPTPAALPAAAPTATPGAAPTSPSRPCSSGARAWRAAPPTVRGCRADRTP